MNGFSEGYGFFAQNSGSYAAAMGYQYVGDVNREIDKLMNDLNTFDG